MKEMLRMISENFRQMNNMLTRELKMFLIKLIVSNDCLDVEHERKGEIK
jgi:hypothetical protein